MKQFAVLLLKIAAIFIAINIATALFLENFTTSRYLNYLRPFKEIKNNYRIIATGDSHAFHVWLSENNGDALNISNGGDNHLDVNRKIKHLEEKGVKAEYFLYEVDPQTFSDYRDKNNNNDVSEVLENTIVPVTVMFYFPLVFNKQIKSELKGAFKNFRLPGKNNIAAEQNTLVLSDFSKRGDDQFFSKKFSEKQFETMKENLEAIREMNMKIIFINYPFHPAYTKMVAASTAYTLAVDSSLRIAKMQNIPMLNYHDAFCLDQHFMNQDHVSEKGAVLLRKHIKKHIPLGADISPLCIDR